MDEILEDYLEQLKKLEFLYSKSFELSDNTAGRKGITRKQEIADLIFAKIILTARAILKLLPNSLFYYDEENYEIWDFSSVAVLARALLEAYLIFYYLCIDDISDIEYEFRYKLWQYHSEKERERMLKYRGVSGTRMTNLSRKVEDLKNDVINAESFKKLERREKKQALRNGITLKKIQIVKRAGVSENYYNTVYSYLSNYAHTSSFSISQLRQFKTYDEESINLLKVFTDYCIAFLSFSIRDYVKVFPDQRSSIDKDCWDIIEDWESILKNIFDK